MPRLLVKHWARWVLGIYLCLLGACSAERYYDEVETEFLANGHRISGVLIVPKSRPEGFPVVVFVHGDGALPYDAFGYYTHIWNRFAKRGIGAFAWDKPGMGDSAGHWLHQNMDDRADNVIAAIDHIKSVARVDANRIGLFGFSQAGWVLPLVATKSDYPDFMVLISGAINWMNQGAYLTRRQLQSEGVSEKAIDSALEYHRRESRVLQSDTTYDEYRRFWASNYPDVLKKNSRPMTLDRYRFVMLNWRYDARAKLDDIKCPFLAIFGDQDLNVDFNESAKVYREAFKKAGHHDVTIKVFPGATHSLLNAGHFQTTKPDAWWLVKLKLFEGNAFAGEFLDFLVNWIAEKTNKN